MLNARESTGVQNKKVQCQMLWLDLRKEHKCLKWYGDCLRQALGSDVYLSRIGGDEFLALLGNLSPNTDRRKNEYITSAAVRVLDVDGQQLSAIASLGVVYHP